MSFERWPVPSGTSYYKTISGSGFANTKGSYAEISSAVGIDSSDWQFQLFITNAANRGFLFDVAIGAAGSEVIQLPNLLSINNNGNASVLPGVSQVFLGNTDIASGTRVAARCQCSSGSSSASSSLLLRSSSLVGRNVGVTYGADTASSKGTTVDPGASANTKGSYVELSSAISATRTRWFMQMSLNINSGPAFATWSLDFATGAAGAEVVQVPDILQQSDNLIMTMVPGYYIFEALSITSGTRIAIRAKCSITDATDRLLTCLVTALDTSISSGSSSVSAYASA